jgi:hypothetical protein
MNQSEKQTLVDEFQDWLRSSFLPEQEKRKGTKMTQAEWEWSYNCLSMMFASFICFGEGPPLHDIPTALAGYEDHVRTILEPQWSEYPSEEEQKKEMRYHCWPVSVFVSRRMAERN